jgi:hypothetical protein
MANLGIISLEENGNYLYVHEKFMTVLANLGNCSLTQMQMYTATWQI